MGKGPLSLEQHPQGIPPAGYQVFAGISAGNPSTSPARTLLLAHLPHSSKRERTSTGEKRGGGSLLDARAHLWGEREEVPQARRFLRREIRQEVFSCPYIRKRAGPQKSYEWREGRWVTLEGTRKL